MRQKTFREKITDAMLGESMEQVALDLTDALGFVLRDAAPSLKARTVAEATARIARLAYEKDKPDDSVD